MLYQPKKVLRLQPMIVYVLVIASCFGLYSLCRASAKWEKIVKAAGTERTVVVSVPANAELREQMEGAFETRFPSIDLELVPMRASKAVRRIANEIRAGVRYFDAHVGGTVSMLSGLVEPGFANPLEPYMLLPEVRDPRHWWGGHIFVDKPQRFAYTFNAYMSKNTWYNKNMVNPSELESYDDLLKAKWKDRIGFSDPRIPGGGSATWSYMWSTMGEQYLKKLVQQNLQIVPQRRLLAEWLARGKLAVTIGLTYPNFQPFVEAGLPVAPLAAFREGTFVTAGHGNLVVIKNPPHPNAVKVFVNWLLSKEGQEVFTNAMGAPTRRLDVDTTWIHEFGVIPAKDVMTAAEYYRHENQSAAKIQEVVIPSRNLALRLLR